ncbi:MAG TPA: hypothetical protein VGH29_03605, partial [Candidatus Binataceae bacterium]
LESSCWVLTYEPATNQTARLRTALKSGVFRIFRSAGLRAGSFFNARESDPRRLCHESRNVAC